MYSGLPVVIVNVPLVDDVNENVAVVSSKILEPPIFDLIV